MLGISTCWWDGRALRGDEILGDVLELGMKGVELEYRLTYRMWEQMRHVLLDEAFTVLSVHNFFPKPEMPPVEKGSGDLFLLSSTDQQERELAVKHSIRTIAHAQELGARAVVFHLGRVDMPNPTEDLRRLYKNGKIGQAEGLAFIAEQRHIRKASRKKNLNAVLQSVKELNRVADQRGVFIGIENRYHFYEIPDFEEIGIILKEFEGGRVGYWHDVGHARVLENLGILQQKNLLEAYSDRMIGVHLHDVIGLADHLAPGQGEIEYGELGPFLEPAPIKILEVHPKVARKELLKGIQFVETLRMGRDG